MSNFEDVKNKLLKASKGTRLAIKVLSENSGPIEYLPTETYDLNRVLSGSLFNGVRNKTLTFLVGPETSGKSSFMCLNLAAAQRMGYTPLIIDTEFAWTDDFCRRWGINTNEALVIPWSRTDEIMVKLTEIIDSGATRLAIVLDSIGAMFRDKVLDDGKKGDVKADQGKLQQDIKIIMKMLVQIVKLQDSIGFMSGHYYGNPNSYGGADEIGGGKYPKLASDIIITLKKSNMYENPNGKTLSEKGKIVGGEITAATIKNRVSPPFQEAKFSIDYRKGVDKLAGILEIAEDMGLIEASGSWITCPTLDLKVQGRVNFIDEMKKIDTMPLLNQIEKVLSDSQYSTVNKTLKESVESGEPVEGILEETPEENTESVEKVTFRKKKK